MGEEKETDRIRIVDLRVHPGDSAFLIDDGHTAILYDSGFAFTGNALCDKVEACLGNRVLDFIFLTHSHYDHALGSAYLKRRYPDCRIVAGKHAAAVFEKPSARRMMRELDQKVAASEGVTDYEDLIDRLSVDLTVEDGDSIDTGAFVFEAIALPGHTKCSFGYFCRSLGLLLGAETLGVYDGASEVLPAYLVGYQMALASIERVLSLAPKAILVPHYGLLEGALAKRYLSRSRKSAEETALWIFTELSKGVSEQEIVKAYRERVYHGYIRTIYPVDAMELNTGIMVSLIRRELMPDQG